MSTAKLNFKIVKAIHGFNSDRIKKTIKLSYCTYNTKTEIKTDFRGPRPYDKNRNYFFPIAFESDFYLIRVISVYRIVKETRGKFEIKNGDRETGRKAKKKNMRVRRIKREKSYKNIDCIDPFFVSWLNCFFFYKIKRHSVFSDNFIPIILVWNMIMSCT